MCQMLEMHIILSYQNSKHMDVIHNTLGDVGEVLASIRPR